MIKLDPVMKINLEKGFDVMKINRLHPKGNVSAASVRRVWRVYKTYIERFIALSKMEDVEIAENIHERLAGNAAKLDWIMSNVSARGSSETQAQVVFLWYSIRDYPHPEGVVSGDRYDVVFNRLSYCDDLLRFAVASYNQNNKNNWSKT